MTQALAQFGVSGSLGSVIRLVYPGVAAAARRPVGVLTGRLPLPVVCLAGAVAIAAWLALHSLRRTEHTRRSLRVVVGAVRVAVASLVAVCAFEVAGNWLLFAAERPVWVAALLAGMATEALISLYGLERGIVGRRWGRLLTGLRVLAALLLIGMLLRPVRSTEKRRDISRFVAVLVDESASMRLPDNQLTASEKVRLSEVALSGFPRRLCQLDAVVARLRDVRLRLVTAGKSLGAPEGEEGRAPEAGALDWDGLRAVLKRTEDVVAREAGALDRFVANPGFALGTRLGSDLTGVAGTLGQGVRESLKRARRLAGDDRTATDAGALEQLSAGLGEAARSLVEVEPVLLASARDADQAFYDSFSDEHRQLLDAIAQTDRLTLAYTALFGAGTVPGDAPRGGSLLAGLGTRYGIRIYRFAETASEASPDRRPDTTAGASEPESPPPSTEGSRRDRLTDLAGALETVMADVPSERLAGIVVLTDGRHNAEARVEPLAERIGLQGVPVCPIVFGGGSRPATDAAIVSVEAPETVYSDDRMLVSTEVKLDGLAGQTVEVTLFRDGEPVDSQRIEVTGNAYRRRVQLADEPEDPGLQRYSLGIGGLEGEVLSTNNQRPLAVRVSDDRTKLLLVDGYPRWEFRYLKNLFSDRDRTVDLQYVLLHPDRIAGQGPRPVVPAAVARAGVNREASALPAGTDEWLKFDAVILGDVEPGALDAEALSALRTFVEERAGTLIVVAGARFMPHAFAHTELRDLLPVACPPAAGTVAFVPSPEPSFRAVLTPEGRQHVITRLVSDPSTNLDVWDALPDLHWRHPLAVAKEGTTVLAYAVPVPAPDFLAVEGSNDVPDEEVLARRRRFVREHVLVASANVGLGRTLYLGFDRTWRLRYKSGDPYHHRFWGQVLRWATADKLPAGTDYVRLGTDRPRYAARSEVRVRAKLVQPDHSPIVSEDVEVKILRDDALVLRRRMQYVADSPGMYVAVIPGLAPGDYRAELQTPAGHAPSAALNGGPVTTEFSVDPEFPEELVELTADRGLLERLATATGGTAVDVHRASEAMDFLRPPVFHRTERRQFAIWNSWPMLLLILLSLGAEWGLRKRARLP